MKRTWKILLVIICSILLALVFTHFLHRPSNKIIAQWKQSESVNYKSFDPYFLSIIERDVNWTYFPLNWERHYEIYVGGESGIPGYGHFIEFSFHPGFDDVDVATHLKKSIVDWSDAGVTFKEASGHILFIPKDMFIGGR
jgi:hypothetical protein